jgi:hypothetical protein
MMAKIDAMPDSIAGIGRRTATGLQPFDFAVREFLDSWQVLDQASKRDAIHDEPDRIGVVEDAYLAALAEHLAQMDGLSVPDWTEQPDRFLKSPFFAGGLQSLKATLLVESPLAFRRRLIFISANALSRPRREFMQDNALNVSNLDV